MELEAYAIRGNNYVKLQGIGKAVDGYPKITAFARELLVPGSTK